ncbi:GGDEF domain-containing phosphodiesterase [Sphingobium sufflavum]|uniref:putative bifunctional diguanylate cyclase/phosphodiesterase n=1 Tax=Sphingobium sufflavum TaxID=1129547 RepID=UPI001F1AC59A|nr:GGDEF domain-containing phosphodiesterase [Sphingobium sufflavum]MCE7798211.1 GGDEF domain-containing phosphodiesterase [Sphingobium sufflavum]
MLDAPPVFILSPEHREPLSVLAVQAGWKPVAARRRERAESRYLGSLARTALVDLRGVEEAQALDYVGSLAEAVEASGGAILLIVDDALEPALLRLIAAGGTHFLTGEVTGARLRAALASADKLAERLVGNLSAVRNRHAVQRSDALFWRWRSAERILSVSPALAAMLQGMAPGVDHARAGVADLVRVLDRSDRAGAIAAIRHAVDDLMPAAFAHSVPGKRDRRLVQHLYPDPAGFSGEVEELDTRRRADNRDRDFMTGLASRQGALGWIGGALGAGDQVIILLIGLAGLDRVNTGYGRMVGDAMLSRVAVRLSRMAAAVGGDNPLVARIAGAEFIIGMRAPAALGEKALVDRAALIAPQLLGDIDRPFNAGDHLIRLTARGGIAVSVEQDSAEAILRRASSALADARRTGANGGVRVRVAEGGSIALHHDRIDSDLRLALDRGEIQILFQPQYAMADDRITGVEALARWRHPVHGEIGAGALFAIAERSDFLVPLSDHIHARALEAAASWPDSLAHLRVAINVTAADIAQPEFVDHFLDQVSHAGIDRERVTLEITESGLIENLGAAAMLLTRLRSAGFLVAIDDFGTGYSSLAYLKSLPLDYLKIDSTIAQDIVGSHRDRIIVRAIIDMARSLDLHVIAEGVETEQQLALLARAGCDVYQGFLRSRPLESAALIALVEDSVPR